MKSRNALVALPLALALANQVVVKAPFFATAPPPARSSAATTAARRGPQAKEFNISLRNLRDWAARVVVTLDGVRVRGSSNVHGLKADCEIHFGADASSFQGEPDGLVLEPMNACVQAFPGKSTQKDSDWTEFAERIKNNTITASGVPRIWPEHLSGGGGDSNPDHAVELHPLTKVVFNNQSFDFAPNVFAPEDYRGGVAEETALAIVQKTTVSVARSGDSVEISFRSGRIGNFTVLEIIIDRASIASDGDGSFRMNGEVVIDDETIVPVRIVTAKGSPINDEIERIKSRRRAHVSMEALVLFSLSPESLLEAANQSNGSAINVDRPIQLILYGPPSS